MMLGGSGKNENLQQRLESLCSWLKRERKHIEQSNKEMSKQAAAHTRQTHRRERERRGQLGVNINTGSAVIAQQGKRGRQPLLERERDAEGSCSEAGGGIAQECNHGFGVEGGLSWLAKLVGGKAYDEQKEEEEEEEVEIFEEFHFYNISQVIQMQHI
ncbi:hypothetical protein PAMP_001606 [Pampus punctatissimus]